MSSLSRLLYRAFSTAADPTISIKSMAADLFKERDVKKVVELFKKSSDCERFRSKTGLYKTIVRRLATAEQFRSIEEILEHQKTYKDITHEAFAVRLIDLYGKSGMFDHASKLFDELPELKCDRTVKSFNALLHACLNSKKFDVVDGYFRELPEKLDVKPDVVTYTMLIKAFCEMGSLDAAVSALDEMEKNGLEPDLVTFNILLHAFYEKNQFEEGQKLWARMEKKNIVPDARSYDGKLVGLISQKKLSEAAELIDELGAKGLKPNAFSYNALIKAHCEDGNLKEVKRWYRECRKNKCVPIKETFATIVPFACKKGDFPWAYGLCKHSFDRHYLVDTAVVQLVVDGLVKKKMARAAKKLVHLVSSKSTALTGSTVTLNLTLPESLETFTRRKPRKSRKSLMALVEHRENPKKSRTTNGSDEVQRCSSKDNAQVQLRKVHEQEVRRLAAEGDFKSIDNIIIGRMKNGDFTSERFTMDIISLFGIAGKFEDARKLFDEMPQRNCIRTRKSFNALLTACVNSKKYDEITNLFRKLPKELSIKPSRSSYKILLRAYSNMGSFDSLLLEIGEMVMNDDMRFRKTVFNTLLNALYRDGKFDDAEKVWTMMEYKNVTPNGGAYNPKLRALVADNRISEAVQLFEEMGSKYIKPDIRSFNALIKSFCQEGNLEEARRFYREINQVGCSPSWETFEMLLCLACEKNDFDFSQEICKEVTVHRCIFNKSRVKRVIDGMIKDSKLEKAEELVELANSIQ